MKMKARTPYRAASGQRGRVAADHAPGLELLDPLVARAHSFQRPGRPRRRTRARPAARVRGSERRSRRSVRVSHLRRSPRRARLSLLTCRKQARRRTTGSSMHAGLVETPLGPRCDSSLAYRAKSTANVVPGRVPHEPRGCSIDETHRVAPGLGDPGPQPMDPWLHRRVADLLRPEMWLCSASSPFGPRRAQVRRRGQPRIVGTASFSLLRVPTTQDGEGEHPPAPIANGHVACSPGRGRWRAGCPRRSPRQP